MTRTRRPTLVIVHTRASPCRCHEFFLAGAPRLGLRTLPVPVEELFAARDEIQGALLVAEHVDTYLGFGALRPLVRHVVESWGGKLVGSGAAAAQVCDDKIEARVRLEAARLRMPRARLLRTGKEDVELPAILKRPFEHGSRGVTLVRTMRELQRVARTYLAQGDGTLLAEEYVEGRELAVGVIERSGRPMVLPPVEVAIRAGATYDGARKWRTGREPTRSRAVISPPAARRIARDSLRAFRALGLRDYARFDLRLPEDGIPRFLEANVRPSVEPGTEFRLAAELAGLDGRRLLASILASAARRHRLAPLALRLGSIA
ncbi:MAG: ATP-grasp domain-containing protein [Planctomycetaceae bacterium]